MDSWTALIDAHRAGRRAHDLDLRAAVGPGQPLQRLQGDRLDLREADLRAADLSGARLGDCRLEDARLADLRANAATLRRCVLDRALAPRTQFGAARLEDSQARGADLGEACLRGAMLSATSFERACLARACLAGARGAGVVFRGADLSSASLEDCRFDDADFRGADLRGVQWRGALLRDADFRGALLDPGGPDPAICPQARFDDVPATAPWARLATELAAGADPQQQLARALQRAGLGLPAASGAQLAALLQGLATAPTPDNAQALLAQHRAIIEQLLPPMRQVLGDSDWRVFEQMLAPLSAPPATPGEPPR